MIKPSSDRLDYGKLLAPPDGYILDAAVGTSYSLDFDALVGICMALGLSADTDSQLLNNPVYLLDTLRKSGDRIAFFCQAGQIHVPGNITALYILLEKIVFQVQVKEQKPSPQRPSFHPKFWLIRYVNDEGNHAYRTIVLSRNLTFDRSWDVAVALNGEKQKNPDQKSRPIADFVEYLRGFISNTSDNSARIKRKMLRELSSDIEHVAFQTERKEFIDFEFLPVGIPKRNGDTYNMDETNLFSLPCHELLVISPFISGMVFDDFRQMNKYLENKKAILITRPEALFQCKQEHFDQFDVYTMKDMVVDGETAISEDDSISKKQDIHAKLFMWRRYSDSELYLGSLNATHSALHGNVEFMLRLVSKNRWMNMDKLTKDLFNGDPDNPDNPFCRVEKWPEKPEQEDEVSAILEQKIKAFCRLPIKATVSSDDEKYKITLQCKKLNDAANMKISPLLSNKAEMLSPLVVIKGLTLLQLSEFYTMEARDGEACVRRVVKIPTENIPGNRENAIVNDVIKDTKSFYQYLAFLLGDDYIVSIIGNDEIQNGDNKGSKPTIFMPALYERMLKTAALSPEKLNEIEYILRMLDTDGIIPEGFSDLYHAFRKAAGSRG